MRDLRALRSVSDGYTAALTASARWRTNQAAAQCLDLKIRADREMVREMERIRIARMARDASDAIDAASADRRRGLIMTIAWVIIASAIVCMILHW